MHDFRDCVLWSTPWRGCCLGLQFAAPTASGSLLSWRLLRGEEDAPQMDSVPPLPPGYGFSGYEFVHWVISIMDRIWNLLYKALGLAFLVLGKAKHHAAGYGRARSFSSSDFERCIDYDVRVVDEWLDALEKYTCETQAQIVGRSVLELGPGADFGVPLYLLSKGVENYCAVDAYPLALEAPSELHDAMLERIGRIGTVVPISALRKALTGGQGDSQDATPMLRYVVKEDFDIAAACDPSSIDFVFSQAAFEHFDDVEAVIRQVGQVARSGARLIAGIDLQTHARWLRERDPLNIYRFSERTYKLLGFRSMPNRVPCSEYRRLLEKHGWKDVQIRNTVLAEDSYFERVRDSLEAPFRKDETRLLWFVVCATRS